MCSQAPCPIALWCGLLLTSSQRFLAGWQRCCKGPRCPLKRSSVLELNVSPACCLHRYSCWYAPALKSVQLRFGPLPSMTCNVFLALGRPCPSFPKLLAPLDYIMMLP